MWQNTENCAICIILQREHGGCRLSRKCAAGGLWDWWMRCSSFRQTNDWSLSNNNSRHAHHVPLHLLNEQFPHQLTTGVPHAGFCRCTYSFNQRRHSIQIKEWLAWISCWNFFHKFQSSFNVISNMIQIGLVVSELGPVKVKSWGHVYSSGCVYLAKYGRSCFRWIWPHLWG